jgi:hypothetical protein
MLSAPDKVGTHQKALSLNLDATFFGSFAEIGAGQEVARWFLRVGGASGTVAKTISAYDKEVSDDLYGAGTRYVSRQRLEAMLESEWRQLLAQLEATRGKQTRFFSFVDTIAARNYSGTNECHGWVGLRFLQRPHGAPNDVILHVNLKDPTNVQQQEAVGILGVNLIYAAVHHLNSAKEYLSSIFEELGLERMEIDLMDVSGPAFEGWDQRVLQLELVTGGFAEAVVFPADGKLVPPTEVLYKKAIVLAPGAFDSVRALHAQLIEKTLSDLPPEELEQSKGSLGLFCLSCVRADEEQQPDSIAQHMLRHVDQLQKLGSGVLVFREREFYKMSTFVNRFTKSRIHFAVGLSALILAFQDRYNDLAGRLLEGIARLFQQNVRVSVYPMSAAALENRLKSANVSGWQWKETDGIVYADDLHPGEPLDHLYRYLLGTEFILPIRTELALAKS